MPTKIGMALFDFAVIGFRAYRETINALILFDLCRIIACLCEIGIFTNTDIIPCPLALWTANDHGDFEPGFAQFFGTLTGIFMHLESTNLNRERGLFVGCLLYTSDAADE